MDLGTFQELLTPSGQLVLRVASDLAPREVDFLRHFQNLSRSYPRQLARAIALEGHPDTVAAALLGGFVLGADGRAERFDVPPGLEAAVVVPREPLRTAEARAMPGAPIPALARGKA